METSTGSTFTILTSTSASIHAPELYFHEWEDINSIWIKEATPCRSLRWLLAFRSKLQTDSIGEYEDFCKNLYSSISNDRAFVILTDLKVSSSKKVIKSKNYKNYTLQLRKNGHLILFLHK